MIEVKELSEKTEWNTLLVKNINYNIFSTFEWGEYKKNSGWIVKRLTFYKSGNFLGQCQLIYKKKFFLSIGWTHSGINYTSLKNLSLILDEIKKYLNSCKYHYQRFSFFQEQKASVSFEYHQLFAKSKKEINSDFTIVHNITKDTDIVSKMSSNHRYYYKKSLKNDLNITINDDINMFVDVHNDMTSLKKLDKLSITVDELNKLYKCFKDNIKILTVFKDEKAISSCLILVFKDQAYYYLAASNDVGRKTYASYYMIKELFSFLVSNDIKFFNFMGITPYDKNAYGVNKFKLGFGGDVINYLGEWEVSNSKLISFLVNKIYL